MTQSFFARMKKGAVKGLNRLRGQRSTSNDVEFFSPQETTPQETTPPEPSTPQLLTNNFFPADNLFPAETLQRIPISGGIEGIDRERERAGLTHTPATIAQIPEDIHTYPETTTANPQGMEEFLTYIERIERRRADEEIDNARQRGLQRAYHLSSRPRRIQPTISALPAPPPANSQGGDDTANSQGGEDNTTPEPPPPPNPFSRR